jgi:hypothetical protein
VRKTNYSFERRQRELDKQKKREEKRLSKLARKEAVATDEPDATKAP